MVLGLGGVWVGGKGLPYGLVFCFVVVFGMDLNDLIALASSVLVPE